MDLTKLQSITVSGFELRVEDKTLDLARNGHAGEFHQDKHEIWISADVDNQHQVNILVHELTHAIYAFYLEGWEEDERIVSALANGWMQVLRDNPEIIAAIQALDTPNTACQDCDGHGTGEYDG